MQPRLRELIEQGRVHPRHASKGLRPFAAGARFVGAFALGAAAIGALAIGAVAIGRLAVGRARIRRVEIDELIVRRLRVVDELNLPGNPPSERERERLSG